MKRMLLGLIVLPLLLVLSPVIFSKPAYAAAGSASDCGKSQASKQVFKGIEETGSSASASDPCNDTGLTKAVAVVIEILSFVTGIAAIIAIISAGFKYITSGGDSNKITNAKNTLIYALIGIAIAAIAQVIVHFVINVSSNSIQPTTNKKKKPAASSMIERPSVESAGSVATAYKVVILPGKIQG